MSNVCDQISAREQVQLLRASGFAPLLDLLDGESGSLSTHQIARRLKITHTNAVAMLRAAQQAISGSDGVRETAQS